MFDGTGFAETMLGLEGFRVLDLVGIVGDDLVIKIETVTTFSGCRSCGVQAVPQERRTVMCRVLECFGRPVRLAWLKRRWRCPEAACEAKTWTETNPGFSCRVLLTRRAGIAATVAVGRDAASVSGVARRFGVAWDTIHTTVQEYGTALVDDPGRVAR